MARSRINQRNVRQTERNLILIVVGIVAFLILFLFFGVKLLVNFSLFVEKKTDNSEAANVQTIMIPPVLDPVLTSTNSALFDVTGTAGSGKYVALFLNGKQVKKADIQKDSTFSFRGIKLTEGSNDIKVRAYLDNKNESRFSEVVSVKYSNKAPTLSIDFPTENETYHKENNPLHIKGKTDSRVRVTVNDFWALVNEDGSYSYNLPLKGGDNEIKVVATDDAGNKTEKTIKISYSE